MAFQNNSTYPSQDNQQTTENTSYDVKVLKVRPIKDNPNCVFFNAVVNGVKIFDMKYIFYTDSETGEECSMIGFPSEKYTNEAGEVKYSNKASFFISDELQKNIYDQIEAKLAELAKKKKS